MATKAVRDLVRRARRYVRKVHEGVPPPTDPDESVRIVVREAPAPRPRRPLFGGAADDDDDEEE